MIGKLTLEMKQRGIWWKWFLKKIRQYSGIVQKPVSNFQSNL